LRTAQQLLILVAPAAGMIMLGGLRESSGVILWSLFAPLGAVAFDRPRRAWPWFAAFVATILLALVLSEVVRPDGADLPEAFVRTFDVLNIVVVSAVALLLLVTFARGRDIAQARVETLLLNVLPTEIAQRLQSDPNSIADHFDEASILFADVVDFTPLSSRLDAREVVGLLDRLFTSFDELVDRYEVEKIKTIGDCYMVAAGVPTQRPDHAQALAGLGLEMRECAKRCLPERDGHDLRLRIGISSGPVVAGVIGRRRFLYDLWGDTVNMASRMESHGTPDEIQITRSTWELLDDHFVTEPIGLVDVKGKGKVETWRLVGPRAR
jgi:guanylate cyclase